MELPRLPAATGSPDASGSRIGVASGNVTAGKYSVLSNVGSSPGNVQTNADRAASAQVLAALLSRNAVTTLAQNPATGSTIDARVDTALGDDLYVVTVSGSGQQLVARSAVTLTPNSVLSARVALVDGTVVLQRLDVSDSLRTDALTAVRAQLTAAGAVGQAVLDAFEHAGAPLEDARLAAAVDDLIELIERSAAPRTSSGATPGTATPARVASAPVPTASAQVPTASGQLPTASGQVPTASGQLPTASAGAKASASPPAAGLGETPPSTTKGMFPAAVGVTSTARPQSPASTGLPTRDAARAPGDTISTVADASTNKLGPTIRDAADLLPRGTLRERADAHAALAMRALPASPTMVALALRALDGRLPNLAATLPAVTAAAATVQDTAAARTAAFNSGPATTSALTAATVGALPNAPALPSVPATAVHTGARSTVIATAPPVSIDVNDLGLATVRTPMNPAPSRSAVMSPAIVSAAAVPVTDAPSASDATATPERFPSVARPITVPIAERTSSTHDPAVTSGTSRAPLTRAVVPDLRDGSAAVLRALALSGLRERGDLRSAEPTLLRVIASHSTSGLAAASAAQATPAERAADTASTLHAKTVERWTPAAPDALMSAAHSTTTAADSAREGLAQTLIRPQELAEYDTVLAVPLTGHGQPLPARIAVTTRPAGNGPAATWVRVDTELSHLGAVSVRLSGLEGGPLAITIIAGERGVGPLTDVLSELAAALEHLGVQAAVRVAQAEPG